MWAEGHSPLPPFSTRALDGGALTWGALSWRVLCCLGQLFHVEATAFAFIHTSPSFFTPKGRLSGTLWDLAPALLPPPPPASLLSQCGRGIQKQSPVRWQHLVPPPSAAPTPDALSTLHYHRPQPSCLPQSHLSARLSTNSQVISGTFQKHWLGLSRAQETHPSPLPTARVLPFPGLGWMFGGVTTVGGPE